MTSSGRIVRVLILLAVCSGPRVGLAEESLASRGSAAEPFQGVRVLSEKDRMAMLKAYWTRISQERPTRAESLQEWRDRRADLQSQVMDQFGLNPRPSAVPLDLTYGDKLERDDCTITRVGYQSMPGLYATAFLYLPKNVTFPAPAVFHPHGHWANWSADDIVQSRCIGLARRGYVSLAVQYEHYEDLATGLPIRGVFLWNNMRGLDVLESLPEVDKTRIGVTGASGGGMQSMDLAALDPRIKTAVIVAFPTYFNRMNYFHCMGCCNYSPLGAARDMDQQDLIAMIAPKPAAVFTLTGDWTSPSIDHELKEVSGIYNLFAESPQGNAAGPSLQEVAGQTPYRLFTSTDGRFLAEQWDGPHDYTKSMRERMYWWMDWWLKDKHAPGPSPEEPLNLVPTAKLQALQCRPAAAHTWTHANLGETVRPWRKFKPPAIQGTEDLVVYRDQLKKTVVTLLGEDRVVQPAILSSTSQGTRTIDDWEVESLWYTSERDVNIPALLIRSTQDRSANGRPTPRGVAIVAAGNGKNDVFVEPLRSACRTMLREGLDILAIDERLRGEWAYEMSPPGTPPAIAWRGNSRVWGRPELGMAAHDIVAAIDYLKTREDCSTETLRVIGQGRFGGFAALLAAAIDPRIQECVADLNLSDFSRGYSDHDWDNRFAPEQGKAAPILSGILRHGDVGEIASLVAPRSLRLINANPQTDLRTVETAYRLLQAESRLVIERGAGARQVPLVNGDFTQGTAGWTAEGGSAVTLAVETPQTSKPTLDLLPRQTVLSDPVAVQPLTDYRLYVRATVPKAARLTVALERGATRPIVGAEGDWISFQESTYSFLTKPDESSIRLVLSASAYPREGGPILIDQVLLVAIGQIEPVKADGREMLAVSDFGRLPVGSAIGKPKTGQGPYLIYGPNSEVAIAGEEKSGKPALRLLSKTDPYVAIGCPLQFPLQRGGRYRLEVEARGTGTFYLIYSGAPGHLLPRTQAELTPEWKTYTMDFFVESDVQLSAVPALQAIGEAWVKQASLKVVSQTDRP